MGVNLAPKSSILGKIIYFWWFPYMGGYPQIIHFSGICVKPFTWKNVFHDSPGGWTVSQKISTLHREYLHLSVRPIPRSKTRVILPFHLQEALYNGFQKFYLKEMRCYFEELGNELTSTKSDFSFEKKVNLLAKSGLLSCLAAKCTVFLVGKDWDVSDSPSGLNPNKASWCWKGNLFGRGLYL